MQATTFDRLLRLVEERDDGSFGPLHQGNLQAAIDRITWVSTGLQAKPPRHCSGNGFELAIAAAHGPLTSAPKLLSRSTAAASAAKRVAYKDRDWKHVPDCDHHTKNPRKGDFRTLLDGCEGLGMLSGSHEQRQSETTCFVRHDPRSGCRLWRRFIDNGMRLATDEPQVREAAHTSTQRGPTGPTTEKGWI
ncbi:hypothetical protein VTN96DRAFT_3973 [Rasamsonia emersonii]